MRALVACASLVAAGGCTQHVGNERAAATAAPSVAQKPAHRAVATQAPNPRVATPVAKATTAARSMPTFAALATAAATSAPIVRSDARASTAAAPARTQIVSVDTMPSVVHAGDSVSWNVRTSTDIVAVSAHVAAYTIPLRRAAPGRFTLSFVVPSNVPSIFHGTYALDVIGTTSDGTTAKRTVSMVFQ